MLFVALCFGLACFKTSTRGATSDTEKVDDVKEDIGSVQEKLESEQKKKSQLEQELGNIQKSVTNAQQEINKTQVYVDSAKAEISRKEAELASLERKIEFQKKILANLVVELYYYQKNSTLNIILGSEDLATALGNFDRLFSFDEKVLGMIDEIKSTKNKVAGEKENVAKIKEDQERLLSLKEDQKQNLVVNKIETQQNIQEKEATIGELQGKLTKLQGELSGLLGTSYDAKDIQDAASFASKASGVRKDFLLGMLVIESDLGRFTGGCLAEKSKMSSYRLGIFKNICKELDYNWKKQKVSCPPKGYTGTGGAMGVAQFMSDTWMGYKSSIASKTGHNPPDPWNLTDGVTAMGLKLAKGGATKKSGECNAAKLYLSGTTSSKYNWYCDKVLYWAKNYEDKLGG